MPALQARRLRHALVLQVHVAPSEEIVGGGTRHQVTTATEQPCRCGTCSSPTTRRCRGGTLPSKRGQHLLECPGKSSSEDASSPADPVVDSTRVAARDIIRSRLEHSDADGEAKLGLVRRRLVNTSRSAAATKGAGQKRKNWAPGATWTRLGTQNYPRNTVESCSALGTKQETQLHVTQSQFLSTRPIISNDNAKPVPPQEWCAP